MLKFPEIRKYKINMQKIIGLPTFNTEIQIFKYLF